MDKMKQEELDTSSISIRNNVLKAIKYMIIIFSILLIINRKSTLSMVEDHELWPFFEVFSNDIFSLYNYLMLSYQELCPIKTSECINQNITQGRSYNDIDVEIWDCIFQRFLIFSDQGGVIRLKGGSNSMNATSSSFINCTSSKEGGAIYFTSDNSYINMICAFRCSASSYQFGIFQTTKNITVGFLSISACSYKAETDFSVYLSYGNQIVETTNSSMNNAKQVSSIIFNTAAKHRSNYCTFANNYAKDYVCIYLVSKTFTVSSANIVNNNSPSTYGVIRSNEATVRLEYCVFYMNQNILFNGPINVYNSFISHSGITSSTNNNSLTLYQTYRIEFYNALYCNTDNDPLIQTPVTTVCMSLEQSPVQSMCDTFEMTHEQSLKNTPYRTFDSKCTFVSVKRREILVIFALFHINIA